MVFILWWRKHGDIITSISVIIFLIFAVYMIIQDRQLKKEISLNCGWGEEDYFCFCEKSQAMEIKNKLNQFDMEIKGLGGLSNVSLDRGNF